MVTLQKEESVIIQNKIGIQTTYYSIRYTNIPSIGQYTQLQYTNTEHTQITTIFYSFVHSIISFNHVTQTYHLHHIFHTKLFFT